MAAETISRPTFWQLTPTGRHLFYVLAVATLVVFAVGIYRRLRQYRAARPAAIPRFDTIGHRLSSEGLTVLSNRRLFVGDRIGGLWHLAVFWGFLALLAATVILAIDMDVYRPITGESVLVGPVYLVYSLLADGLGLLFVVGLGVALYRRYVRRLDRLWGTHSGIEDTVFLWTLVALGVGGFLLEAVRILGQAFPSFETASFVGYGLAVALTSLGVTPATATAVYPALWWAHTLLALGFVAWIPYGKPYHMLASAANTLFRDDDAGVRLPGVPADATTDSHLEAVTDFSWKQTLDMDACTKCGRCSAVCPATAVGRPLDPQDVILDLKHHRDRGDADAKPIVSPDESVIDPETVDACMACLACMEACPVEIEHLTHLTDMNRQRTEQGTLDRSAQAVFENVLTHDNPFGEPARNRPDWTDDLDFTVPDAREAPVEYLWYVGDAPSYDDRNQRLAKALARLFHDAAVEYGILYADEVSAGNDLRRMGEELLFVDQAASLIEAFEACSAETIVCTDPHAYNTIANEYPTIDFEAYADDPMISPPVEGYWNDDGRIDVVHYTQAIERLVETGRLDVPAHLEYTVTYHDPCHLGRYNGAYEAPRSLVRETGCELSELPRNRSDAVCCGGGGGGLWLDFEDDPKPSEDRLREALDETDAGSDVEKFVVACPGCITMYEDGRKTGGVEDDVDVVDVAELLAEAKGYS